MKNINVMRVILGGIVAGVVIFVAEGFIHSGLLSADWQAWRQVVGKAVHTPPMNVAMALWAACSLVAGLVGVWIYAGIRPRYGAGPKTALFAGFLLWAASHLTGALDMFALHEVTHKIVVTDLALMLIFTPLAVLAGAYFYKE